MKTSMKASMKTRVMKTKAIAVMVVLVAITGLASPVHAGPSVYSVCSNTLALIQDCLVLQGPISEVQAAQIKTAVFDNLRDLSRVDLGAGVSLEEIKDLSVSTAQVASLVRAQDTCDVALGGMRICLLCIGYGMMLTATLIGAIVGIPLMLIGVVVGLVAVLAIIPCLLGL